MNINFTPKELQVIQLLEPKMTPEEICNKVLRDWFNANVQNLRTEITRTSDVDDVLSFLSSRKNR